MVKVLALLLALFLSVGAQADTVPSPPSNLCGPVTGTIASVSDSVTLNCPGASNYLILLSTPSGQTPLIGTMTSTDPVTNGARRFVKTGIGPLEVSTEGLNGAQGAGTSLEYRTVGGGYGQRLSLTSYTSGQATVTILGTFQPTTIFVNGAVHDEQDVALRNGRSFTASTGIMAVSAGNFLSLQFSMPAGTNRRAFIRTRTFGCNQATATVPVEFAGVSNPTANLATTAATVTNRKTGGLTSSAVVTYSMAATHPDTNPVAANPPGGFVLTGGSATYLGSEFSRTVEPGTSFTNWIGGSGGGLSSAARCYITYLWSEEPIN